MNSAISRFAGAVVVATCLASAAYAAEFITVLTGGTSGVYYPMGVALSQIYAKALPDAKASVQATKASAENLNLLQAGRGEVAFTLGDALSDAWKGDADAGFATPLRKLPITRRNTVARMPATAVRRSGRASRWHAA